MNCRRIILAIAFVLTAAIAGRSTPARVAAQAGGWTSIAPVPIPVTGAAAVTGPDGRLYLFGGTDNTSQDYNSAEVYDPTAKAWSSIAPLPVSESYAAATLDNGKIYVIGGFDSLANRSLDYVFAYDPATNSYACSSAFSGCTSSNLAHLPIPSASLGAVTAYKNVIWAVGGVNGTPLSNIQVYDPTTNAWHSGKGLSEPAAGAAIAIAPTYTIFIVGGFDGSTYLNRVETSNLEVPPGGARQGVRGLGRQQASPGKTCFQEIADAIAQRYVQGDPWHFFLPPPPPPPFPPELDDTPPDGAPEPPAPRTVKGAKAVIACNASTAAALSGHRAAKTPSGFTAHQALQAYAPYYVYLLGGSNSGSISNEVDVLNPTTGVWSAGPSLPRPLEYSAAVAGADGTLYVMGGDSGGRATSAAYAFVPPPGPPPPATAKPTPTVTATPVVTSTPVPTATPTATPVPVKVKLKLASRRVKVGQKQTVTVTTGPANDVAITATFPGGHKLHHSGTADSSGKLVWRYKEPKLPRGVKTHSVQISVTVTDSNGQTASASTHYTAA